MRAALLALALSLAAGEAAACRLAMTIGMDVSASIDDREHALQREGLASALLDPEVAAAFLSGADPIELQIYEWSGRTRQTVIVAWTPIVDEGDLEGVAATLRAMPRADREFPTALGQSLLYAGAGFAAVDCPESVINISGDGENNDGIHPRVVVREIASETLRVNGLVVGGNVERLRRYFEENVIHGPGAFVETTLDFEGFAAAMRRKLIRELGPVVEDAGAVRVRAN
jgi:Protein of unknown function (DUF1194)